MRIVHLTTSFPVNPDVVSGVFVERLVQALSSATEQVVVTPAGNSSGAARKYSGYTVHQFWYGPRALRVLAQRPGGIPAALQRNRLLILLVPFFLFAMFIAALRCSKGADCLHGHWAICGLVVGVVGRLLSKKTVTTLRGSDVDRSRFSAVDRAILGGCVRLSERLVCVSEAMAVNLRDLFPQYADRFCVITNGVDDRFFGISRPSGDSKGKAFNLLTVANLVPGKGVADLVSALARIPEETPVLLTVVGDGPERMALERMVCERGQQDRVEFVGSVSPNDIIQYFTRADVFLLASKSEGRPNVVVEAMAAGLPIVATRIDGVAELLCDGDSGYLFEVGNIEQLVTGIRLLFEDPAMRGRLGSAAREAVVKGQMTWRNSAEKYLDIYRTLSPAEAG